MAIDFRALAALLLYLGLASAAADTRPGRFELPLDQFSATSAPCLAARNQGRDLIAEYIDADGNIAFRAGSWLGIDGRYLLPRPERHIASVQFRSLDDTSVDSGDVAIEPCPMNLSIDGLEGLSTAIDARLAAYIGEAVDADRIDRRFRRALSGFRQSDQPHWLAVAHFEYAAFNRSVDRLDQARSHYDLARQTFEQIGDLKGEAAAVNTLGLVALREGRLDPAQAHFSAALELFIALGDQHHVAAVNNNLGMLAMRQGRLQEAAGFLEFALTLLQGPAELRASRPDTDTDTSMPGDGVADLTWALNTLNNLAVVRMRQGRVDLAQRYWRNYLAFSPRVERSLGAAQARHGLGALMLRQGRLDEALQMLGQALDEFFRLEAHRWSREARVEIAWLYYRLGDPELALQFANEAVEQPGDDAVARLKAWLNLARLQRETDALDAALASYDKALDEAGDDGERVLLWRIRSERAHVQLQRGRAAEAAMVQREILDQIGDGEDDVLAARVRYRLARALLQNSDSERAIILLNDAMTVFRDSDDIYFEILALEALADIESASRQSRLAHSRRAVNRAFRLRAQSLSDIRRVGLTGTLRRVEDQHMRLLIAANRIDAAWQHAERIRSATLMDSRRARSRRQNRDDRRALLDEHADLMGRFHRLRLTLDETDFAARSTAMKLRLDEVETALQQMHSESAGGKAIDRDALRARLEPGQLLLSYYESADRLLLWATSPTSSEFAVIEDPGEIRERIHQLQSQLRHPRHAVGAIDRMADELGRRLLDPAADLLESAEELLIQPHGSLHTLPFAVLIHNGQPLMDGWTVRRVTSTRPAASTITGDRQDDPERLLVLADPGWDQRQASQAALPAESLVRRFLGDGLLARLPGTAREAERLATLNGPDMQVSLRTGRQASRQFLMRDGDAGHSTLHFATHGLVDLRYPQLSALLLAEEGGAGPALLRPHEIAGLDIGARLVVLSGCETGRGQVQAGEGALSLTRPFLIAGAQEVVSTLWKIDDARTADFMSAFYRHRVEEQATTAQALAAAQRHMRRRRASAHPYYWAGFILTSTSLGH